MAFALKMWKQGTNLALTLTAEDLKDITAAQSALENMKMIALANGVELSLCNDVVQAKEIKSNGSMTKKRYPGDDKSHTLAETITFVFEQSGSLGFALKMWKEAMN